MSLVPSGVDDDFDVTQNALVDARLTQWKRDALHTTDCQSRFDWKSWMSGLDQGMWSPSRTRCRDYQFGVEQAWQRRRYFPWGLLLDHLNYSWNFLDYYSGTSLDCSLHLQQRHQIKKACPTYVTSTFQIDRLVASIVNGALVQHLGLKVSHIRVLHYTASRRRPLGP